MTQREDAKLTPSYWLEVSDVPMIACTGYKDGTGKCSGRFSITNNEQNRGNENTMRGTVICPKCDTGTGFEMDENWTVTYVSGRSAFGTLKASVPIKSKTLYAEAESSFLAANPDAAAAMCRSSVEIALNIRGLL
ncbi:MAG: hypothetical protein EXR53_03465 [Dehalococcoidia bacterium]|nr:hypothetical protein [Dehalococcoidia bacterium]